MVYQPIWEYNTRCRNDLLEYAGLRKRIEKECMGVEGRTLDEVLIMTRTITWEGPTLREESRTFVHGELVDINDCESYAEFGMRVNQIIADFEHRVFVDGIHFRATSGA